MDIIESVMKGESIGEKTKLATEAGKAKKEEVKTVGSGRNN